MGDDEGAASAETEREEEEHGRGPEMWELARTPCRLATSCEDDAVSHGRQEPLGQVRGEDKPARSDWLAGERWRTGETAAAESSGFWQLGGRRGVSRTGVRRSKGRRETTSQVKRPANLEARTQCVLCRHVRNAATALE